MYEILKQLYSRVWFHRIFKTLRDVLTKSADKSMQASVCSGRQSKASCSWDYWGWSGGAKVLGKLPVLGRPTNLDYRRARAYCACSRCRWGLFGHFFSHLSFLFSFSLSLGDGPI